jgi:hypothetical protein
MANLPTSPYYFGRFSGLNKSKMDGAGELKRGI